MDNTISSSIVDVTAKISSKRRHDEVTSNDDNNIELKKPICEFDLRTNSNSAHEYFNFYGSLQQQQNMMQDLVRTTAYQRAIFDNSVDFQSKTVMDVGAGSGLLSFFAAQVSAQLIYAVEASSVAHLCQRLVRSNRLSDRIKVVKGKVEQIDVPEKVDVIISEPMGYMLVNERMLESFMYARRFLKPGGKMFPTVADMHFALFTDDALYLEQVQRTMFWFNESFLGINLTSLKEEAVVEALKQPVVDAFSANILASRTVKWSIDFEKDPIEKLHRIEIPFQLEAFRTCHVHGIASWFDVGFFGSSQKSWLSTAPSEALTHWYQVRCMFSVPLFVKTGQIVEGSIMMIANDRQSYDITLKARTGDVSVNNFIDLKTPYFRASGGSYQSHSESPSNVYLQAKLPSSTTTNVES